MADESDQDVQVETSSVNSQETAGGENQIQHDVSADGLQIENRRTMIIPITIAPESDVEENDTNEKSINRRNTEGIEGESEMNSAVESDGENDDDGGDILMIDESDRNQRDEVTENSSEQQAEESVVSVVTQRKNVDKQHNREQNEGVRQDEPDSHLTDAVKTGSQDSDAVEIGSQNNDTAALRNLVNIVNGELNEEGENVESERDEAFSEKSQEDFEKEKTDEERNEKTVTNAAKNVPTENSVVAEKETIVEENGAKFMEEMDSETTDPDEADEFSDDDEEDIAPEGVDLNHINHDSEDVDQNIDTSENAEDSEERLKKDTDDIDKSVESYQQQGKGTEMVNGSVSERERKDDEQKNIRSKGGVLRDIYGEGEGSKKQLTIQKRKKSMDMRILETMKSTESRVAAVETGTTPTKVSPAKIKCKQESNTVQKCENKQIERDTRIAPVERPNTRRLSRRLTRDDDDYIT